MERPDILIKLLYQEKPVLTASTLSEIANVCGISCEELVQYIQTSRYKNIDIKQCVVKLIKLYRPELFDIIE